jgi:hypothetical protein
MLGKLFIFFVGVGVAISAVSSSVVDKAGGKTHGAKRFNKLYQTMMTKLIEVRFKAEQYMEKNSLPFSPSPDYP